MSLSPDADSFAELSLDLHEVSNLDSDQAFRVLRRYSQDNNLKLNAVARRLIETGNLPR